jgi:hypothetical protein
MTKKNVNKKDWDGIKRLNVSWGDEVVFLSKDPLTGENRKATIYVVEGLHDGYLEIILSTPANFINLKVRPELGFIEAYHDNKTAQFGETSMNYTAKAYMGFDKDAIDAGINKFNHDHQNEIKQAADERFFNIVEALSRGEAE